MIFAWTEESYSRTREIGTLVRGMRYNGQRPDRVIITYKDFKDYKELREEDKERAIKWFFEQAQHTIRIDGDIYISGSKIAFKYKPHQTSQ